MNVLAFDTSGPHVAAALMVGGHILVQRQEDMARGQAERLIPLLEDLLSTTNMAWQDLTRIGVGIGPGNFTGIRISVSTARGLALGLGIPAIGVSLFQTTQYLSNWAQTGVPAPRDQLYVFDPDKMQKPIVIPADQAGALALSNEHSPQDHVAAIAHLAGTAQPPHDAPAPLYVKPADAAPSSDPPPVILDDA